MNIAPSLCVQCKGRLWCGLNFCPIIEKFSTHKKTVDTVKGTQFDGPTPPGIFVSHLGYPKVNVSPLATGLQINNPEFYDSPEEWFGVPGNKIVEMREQLIRSSTKMPITQASNPTRQLSEIQELSLSKKSLNVDVKLKNKPRAVLSYNTTVAPMGPTAMLDKLKIEDNPKIPKKAEYYFSDGHVLSNTAMQEMYKKRMPVSYLQKMLSIGTLGIQKNRKLVPTRWAITAVDSNISKHVIDEKIKYLQEISETLLFKSSYLDNHFFVLLYPGEWSFELLEGWHAGSSWAVNSTEPIVMRDSEFYEGRKKYANETAGGYYATRIALAEGLINMKRQASCIVFREIGEGYSIPLGVWQVRENVRNALKQKPLRFYTEKLALDYIEKKMKLPFNKFREKSDLLDRLFHQRKLRDFC